VIRPAKNSVLASESQNWLFPSKYPLEPTGRPSVGLAYLYYINNYFECQYVIVLIWHHSCLPSVLCLTYFDMSSNTPDTVRNKTNVSNNVFINTISSDNALHGKHNVRESGNLNTVEGVLNDQGIQCHISSPLYRYRTRAHPQTLAFALPC
jgi:hypothetical protein